MKYLIVVDMQNDFIDGSLGAYNAPNIVEYVKERIFNFDGEVIYTMDTHDEDYQDTQEGQKLPIVHCQKGSFGWQLKEGIYKDGSKIFEKGAFGSADLALYLVEENKKKTIDSIEILGICTDICVISNAITIKTMLPNTKIVVDSKGCAGVTLKSHENALQAMGMCQIEIG